MDGLDLRRRMLVWRHQLITQCGGSASGSSALYRQPYSLHHTANNKQVQLRMSASASVLD
jgi:hypothetical protein